MSAKEPSNVSPDFINELLYANFQSMQVGLSLSRLKSGAKFCFSFLFKLLPIGHARLHFLVS